MPNRVSLWLWLGICCTVSLHTQILDFRGFDSSRILNYKGWNSQAPRELPGKLESSNLSREILSIGRLGVARCALAEEPMSDAAAEIIIIIIIIIIINKLQ